MSKPRISYVDPANVEHHQNLAGSGASLAPSFETDDALERSKQAADYRAKTNAKLQSQAAQ